MTSEDFDSFVPVSLNLGRGPPSVDWGDLRGVRFSEPFFDQTIESWAGGPNARLRRTGLEALLDLDPTLLPEPAALVFHLSRCGSTLVSRLLATLPRLLVLSEPAPLNSVLMEEMPELDPVQLLRALVGALGRARNHGEGLYVLKLSSWNIRRIALYRRAFPRARLVWLQREPNEVLASLLREPAGWSRLRNDAARARSLFGITEEDLAACDLGAFCGRAVAALLESAGATPADAALYLDYEELPEAVWTRVAPFLDLTLGEGEIVRMKEEARFDAKKAGRHPFGREATSRPALPPALQDFAARVLAPLYDELDARRRRQIGETAAA